MIAEVKKKTAPESCNRCGGFMVPEWTGDPLVTGWRCVMCGERVDPIILEHRRRNVAREDAEKLFARLGHDSVN